MLRDAGSLQVEHQQAELQLISRLERSVPSEEMGLPSLASLALSSLCSPGPEPASLIMPLHWLQLVALPASVLWLQLLSLLSSAVPEPLEWHLELWHFCGSQQTGRGTP